MSAKEVFIGRLLYQMPDSVPNEQGDMVLLKMRCFGPLEAEDLGIDADGRFYEEYCWFEDDLYKDENCRKYITKEEMAERIKSVQVMFERSGRSEWAEIYKKLLDELNMRE